MKSRYCMVLLLCVLAGATVLFSEMASATSLDYRHEYNTHSHHSKDRFRIDHRFDNHVGVYIEAKWKHYENSSFDDDASDGHETGVSYYWQYTDRISLLPEFVLDSTEDSVTYKSQVTTSYRLTDHFTTDFRYRYGLKVYDDDSHGDEHYHQFNWTGNYQFSWGKLGYDFEFQKYSDHVENRWKRGSTDHLINLTGEYDNFESGWIPYWEIGMVTGKSHDDKDYNDEHQLRLRLGVKYNF